MDPGEGSTPVNMSTRRRKQCRRKFEWVSREDRFLRRNPRDSSPWKRLERLQKVLVLQRKPQERIGALAIEVEFAAHVGAVVFDSPVVDGKLSADFFAGFTARDQLHNAELGRGEVAHLA